MGHEHIERLAIQLRAVSVGKSGTGKQADDVVASQNFNTPRTNVFLPKEMLHTPAISTGEVDVHIVVLSIDLRDKSACYWSTFGQPFELKGRKQASRRMALRAAGR
jgi:hypothetical protein